MPLIYCLISCSLCLYLYQFLFPLLVSITFSTILILLYCSYYLELINLASDNKHGDILI